MTKQFEEIGKKIAAGDAGQYEAAILWQEVERLSALPSGEPPQPRCPKCGSAMGGAVYSIGEDCESITHYEAACTGKDSHVFKIPYEFSIVDFAQFFGPSDPSSRAGQKCKHCGKEIVNDKSLGWVTACFGDVLCFTEMSRNPRQGGHEPTAEPVVSAFPAPQIDIGKQAELAVRKLMELCDCGREGCDLCQIAKVITRLALERVKLDAAQPVANPPEPAHPDRKYFSGTGYLIPNLANPSKVEEALGEINHIANEIYMHGDYSDRQGWVSVAEFGDPTIGGEYEVCVEISCGTESGRRADIAYWMAAVPGWRFSYGKGVKTKVTHYREIELPLPAPPSEANGPQEENKNANRT